MPAQQGDEVQADNIRGVSASDNSTSTYKAGCQTSSSLHRNYCFTAHTEHPRPAGCRRDLSFRVLACPRPTSPLSVKMTCCHRSTTLRKSSPSLQNVGMSLSRPYGFKTALQQLTQHEGSIPVQIKLQNLVTLVQIALVVLLKLDSPDHQEQMCPALHSTERFSADSFPVSNSSTWSMSDHTHDVRSPYDPSANGPSAGLHRIQVE